ncbi:MAG: LOG family protein, partial [Desulfobacterales bacterium]|nr:LOG family protein [Desulfobacterales bacterium]
MYSIIRKKGPFPSAREEAKRPTADLSTPQTESPSFTLAYEDKDFAMRDELRAVRLQLELLKPELIQHEHHIESTVVIFGSARTPDPETAMIRFTEAEKEAGAKKDDDAEKKLRNARKDLEMSRYYAAARELAGLISSFTEKDKLVVVSGGGPGIMEAANRGAADVGAQSIGLNIVLPHEQNPNPYITPELCFQFHYFAIRKMHFLMRARSLVAFPGG